MEGYESLDDLMDFGMEEDSEDEEDLEPPLIIQDKRQDEDDKWVYRKEDP